MSVTFTPGKQVEHCIALLLSDKQKRIRTTTLDWQKQYRDVPGIKPINVKMSMRDFGFVVPMGGCAETISNYDFIDLDARPKDVGYSFDVSTMYMQDPANGISPMAVVRRMKSRRRNRQNPEVKCNCAIANIQADMSYDASAIDLRWCRGDWTVDRPDKFVMSREERWDCKVAIQVALNIQFARQFEWELLVGLGNGRGVRLHTDCDGALYVMENRDKLDSGHLPSLMGWVDKHWRNKAHDPDKEIYVRKHLRGRTKFRAFGFDAEIYVPPDAYVQRDQFIAERKEMKRQGLTERTKVLEPVA